jgi:gamma-glutamylcyclotransferase
VTRYFGYGSNMANPVLLALPGVRSLGAAAVDGYRLRFGRDSVRWRAGAADVVPAPGCTVWGELLEVDDEALAVLDTKEGVELGWYRRAEVEVRDVGPALTYTVVQPADPELAPRADYLAGMAAAARTLGFPAGYQQFLADLATEAAEHPEPGRFRTLQPAVAARTGADREQY